MASQIATVAADVAALIEAATLPLPFTVRQLRKPPQPDLSDLDANGPVWVSVVPETRKPDPFTRGTAQDTVVVGIAIQRRVDVLPDGEPDVQQMNSMLEFSEAVANLFHVGVTLSASEARHADTEQSPIYFPQHLTEHQTFTGVVRVSFLIHRNY